jgi:hypothetical protein
MADIINHSTVNSNIKMYIDEVSKGDTTYRFKGWIADRDLQVTELSIGESLDSMYYPEFRLSDRHDILEYYELENGKERQFGLEFEIPIDIALNKKSILSVKLSDDSWQMIGSLLRWITYYSGFNNQHKDVIVVDNFYDDPDLVRDFAMNGLAFSPSKYHKGERATDRFILNGTKAKLEKIIGREIYNWNYEGYANGIFQFCTADQALVYHVDTQMYAGVVYLTPDAPVTAGTAFYKSKVNGHRSFDSTQRSSKEYVEAFKGNSNEMNFYDSSNFELVDVVGNVYNRLVLFNASQIHAATQYFGDSIENSRFFHMFFFDVK